MRCVLRQGAQQTVAFYYAIASYYSGKRFVTVTKTELRKVVTKLDDVRVELLRLRAELLPEEKLTPDEKRDIVKGRREIEAGRTVSLVHLRKELGV
jgi:hypothetical protein